MTREQTVSRISGIINESGESVLNDEGVDGKVCDSIAEEIVATLEREWLSDKKPSKG
jgi:hypothetical protein